MASEPLILVARVIANPGHEEAVRQALLRLVENTRKEKGCLQYDLHRSIEDAANFVFYELWETEEDLKAHANSAFMQAHRERVSGAIAKTVVDRLSLLERARG